MSRARIVAGALVEGDDEGGDAQGNAGGWIHLELMVEEVGVVVGLCISAHGDGQCAQAFLCASPSGAHGGGGGGSV